MSSFRKGPSPAYCSTTKKPRRKKQKMSGAETSESWSGARSDPATREPSVTSRTLTQKDILEMTLLGYYRETRAEARASKLIGSVPATATPTRSNTGESKATKASSSPSKGPASTVPGRSASKAKKASASSSKGPASALKATKSSSSSWKGRTRSASKVTKSIASSLKGRASTGRSVSEATKSSTSSPNVSRSVARATKSKALNSTKDLPVSVDSTALKRKRRSSNIHPADGGVMQTVAYDDFAQSDPMILEKAMKVFDDLFLFPSHSSEEAGPGITVTCDNGPYNPNNQNVNVVRDNYLKQDYGKNVSSVDSNGCVERFLYGTGSGLRTHGISINHLNFRQFTPEMEYIGQSIMQFMQKKLRGKGIIFEDFNIASLIAYWANKRMRKKINFHRDQRYSITGKFLTNENCQKKGTVTAILVFGDTRYLEFILCRHKVKSIDGDKRGPYRVGVDTLVFELKHGTILFLNHRDEELLKRDFYHDGHRTFFKHGSKGVGRGCLSLGIVFRVSVHSREVFADTGRLKLSSEEKERGERSPTFEESDKVLDDYLRSEEKEQLDAEVRSLWIRIRKKFLSSLKL